MSGALTTLSDNSQEPTEIAAGFKGSWPRVLKESRNYKSGINSTFGIYREVGSQIEVDLSCA